MSDTDEPGVTTPRLDDVLVTDELVRRPSRPPDYEAESRALSALAEVMAASSETVLQKLADTALHLCRADSAGISLLEAGKVGEVFCWHAVAGMFAPNQGVCLVREASPCGVVIERNTALLFAYPERHFAYPVPIDPPLVEILAVPFHANGRTVGTIWLAAHTPATKFDAEDVRLLTSLASCAGAAYRLASARGTVVEEPVRERIADTDEDRAFAESIVDTVRDPLLVLDADLRVIRASREFYQTFQVVREETVGRQVYDLGNRQWDIPRLHTLLEEILPRQTTFRDFEVEHRFEYIGRKVMLLSARRLRRKPGEREMILLAIEDVTARRATEASLRESETRRLLAVEAAGIADWTYRPETDTLTFSPRSYLMHRVAVNQPLGVEEHDRLIHPDDRAAVQAARAAALDPDVADDHYRVEFRFCFDDGSVRWLESVGEALFEKTATGRRPVALLGAMIDITEHKEAEAALRESEGRLATLFTLMPAAVYTCDAEGRLSFYNRRAAELWGHEPALGDSLEKYCGAFRMWTPDGVPLPHEQCPMASAVREGRPVRDLEVVIEQPTGARIVVNVNIDPLYDRDGRLTGAINVFVDITDRKRSEAALEAELDGMTRLRELADQLLSAPDLPAALGEVLETAIALHRADRGTVQVCDPAGSCLQYVASRGFDRDALAAIPPIDRDFHSTCAAALRTGESIFVSDIPADPRFAAHCPSAAMLDYRAAFSFPLTTRRGDFLGVLTVHFRDRREPTDRDRRWAALYAPLAAHLIERRRAQEELQQSEERLRLTLSAARMGTWNWEVSSDRHRRDVNLNRLLGLEPVETVLPIEDFFSHIHPEDRDRVRAAFEATVRQGRNLRVDFRVIWPDGEVRWLSDQGDVFGAPDGRYLAGACMDITDRKRMEEALREADRRKDEFLAMLGHELRNPLAPLRGVTETLQRQELDGPAQARAYAMMDRQVSHLGRLVDDLLDVSRITRGLIELRQESVHLGEVADQAVEMAAPAVEGRGHELTVALPRRPLRVAGDAARLTQVVFNLLSNAAKYTAPGGRIWLTLEREGDQAVMRVRDNGSGLKPELLPKVFDLFTQGERTPDRSQGGLGLGLTLVKRLVEMHGGTVAAHSEGPGRGSEFVVRLPILSAEDDQPAPARLSGPPPAAVQVNRTLVVDDVPDIAESFVWMLEGLTREIKMAHSGAAALELAREWQPDLILCDLGMPEMDGYETCRRLRQLPGLAKTVIAAVSGYGGEEYQRKAHEAGFNRHLTKPIGRATLEELVKSAAGT